MNLHQIVAPIVGAVNPLQPVGVLISVGQSEGPDGSLSPAYATPGSITASIGGTFTASADETVLTVAEVLTGSLQIGDVVSGSDGTNAIAAGTAILEQLSGQTGGTGTYLLSGTVTTSGALNPCTVTSASTVLNAIAIATGVLQSGQTLADIGGIILAGTMITDQISGPEGGVGLYALSEQQTVSAETMTTSMTILSQVQPLTAGDLRHMDMLNLQGSHRAFYFNGAIRGMVRVALKGGDLLTTPDGSKWLVTQPLEQWTTAGWCKILATIQNGS